MWRIVHNILAGLGVIFLIGLGVYGFLYIQQKNLNDSASAYTNDALLAITKNWDYEEFKKRASPTFFTLTSETELRNLFAKFTQLGKLEAIQECNGQAGDTVVQGKKIVAAEYACAMKFEKDVATMRLAIERDDAANTWKILGFNVTSNYIAGIK